MSETARDIGNNAIREAINHGLTQLTETQRQLFDRIFPSGVPDEGLEAAHGLIQRTLYRRAESGEQTA